MSTGGLALTTLTGNADITDAGTSLFSYSNSQTVLGYAIGGGLEYSVTDNLNARVEYLFTSFAKANYSDVLDTKFDAGFVRLGLVGHL